MTRRPLMLCLALAACREPTPSTERAPLYGRWEKLEASLPPVTLEIRPSTTSFTGAEGQVWLSGVTYTLPAFVVDSVVTLADPVSSGPARFVGTLQPDGRMRARLDGTPPHEATLVRRKMDD